MYAILKINNNKPTGCKISPTMAELKQKLLSIPFCNENIKYKIESLVGKLPDDNDVIVTPKEYDGFWLVS